MTIDVFDTYVTLGDGKIMHFDVLTPKGCSRENAVKYAKTWLGEIQVDVDKLELKQCSYCHSEVANAELKQYLQTQPYAILKMEGCPN